MTKGAELLTGVDYDIALSSDEEDRDNMTATEEFDEGGQQAQENAVDDKGAGLLTGIDADIALGSDEEDRDDMTATSPGRNDEDDTPTPAVLEPSIQSRPCSHSPATTSGLKSATAQQICNVIGLTQELLEYDQLRSTLRSSSDKNEYQRRYTELDKHLKKAVINAYKTLRLDPNRKTEEATSRIYRTAQALLLRYWRAFI